METYIRESKIPPELRPDAVEVPVEADLHQHGLPILIGVLDLVQAGVIINYKTSGQTPNPEVQTSSYAVLYREATGKREAGIEVHTLVKLKMPKLVVTVTPPMSNPQQTRLFRLIEAYVDGLDRRDYVPSPGLQCVSCEFFDECAPTAETIPGVSQPQTSFPCELNQRGRRRRRKAFSQQLNVFPIDSIYKPKKRPLPAE